MPKKKNKNAIGIGIGVIATVTIVGLSAFALNKWTTPIKLVGGTNEGTSTTASQNAEGFLNGNTQNGGIQTEEDIWGEDLTFADEGEEEIIFDEEINFESDVPVIQDYQSDFGNNINYGESIRVPVTSVVTHTKPSTTDNSSTTNNTNDTTVNSTTGAATPTAPNSTSTTKKDTGMFGYQIDETKSHFFTSKDAWQRNFGFCKIYDDASPLIAFYYDTERILFQYGEYDWMVQLWKGQYGFIFIGSEIGVYHKEKDRDIEFYDCAEDKNCLKMKMKLYRDEDTLLFDRPEGYYWWTTGFVPGKLDRFADRSELKVVAKITFFDKEMTNAFLEGFKKAGFVEESEWVEPDVEKNKSYARQKFYTVSGNTVNFTWQ